MDHGFGVKSGAEEHKMGLKGSSTTALYFDNVPVPVENLLGEIGRGHVIALNVLNVGRLKLGAGALGAARSILAVSLAYARERKAFGSAIAELGAIQNKLAEMAIRMFAAESMIWRVVGQIESRLEDFSWSRPEASQIMLRAVEEYAAECSMVKVYGSEMLGYVADEGVQIHGGYGYHEDYAVERAYRDARIHRIFEGTNEINRLVICGMLLKRAARGQLALFPAMETLRAELMSGQAASGKQAGDGEESLLVANAKRIGLLALSLAYEKYSSSLEQQQEVLMHIADILTETFAMESVFLRTRKLGALGRETAAEPMCSVFLRDAMARIELAARNVLGTCSEGAAVRANLAALRILAGYEPADAVALRRGVAGRLLARERYAI